jgi:hypothetical protein
VTAVIEVITCAKRNKRINDYPTASKGCAEDNGNCCDHEVTGPVTAMAAR